MCDILENIYLHINLFIFSSCETELAELSRWWLRDIICSRSESDSELISAISIEVENSYLPLSVF